MIQFHGENHFMQLVFFVFSYSSGAPVNGNISVVAVMEAVHDEDSRESRGYEMSLDSVSALNVCEKNTQHSIRDQHSKTRPASYSEC